MLLQPLVCPSGLVVLSLILNMATYNKSINHYKKISHYDNTLSLESGVLSSLGAFSILKYA